VESKALFVSHGRRINFVIMKRLFFILVSSLLLGAAYGQEAVDTGRFCKVLERLVSDSRRNFNVEKKKAKDIQSDGVYKTYVIANGIPGALTSRVIDDNELRFESIVYRGKSKEELSRRYLQYKKLLEASQKSDGTGVSSERNYQNELEAFPTVRYHKLYEVTVLLKAEMSKPDGVYTAVISIVP